MITKTRNFAATIFLMIFASIGTAQVTNAPVAANAQVLEIGPDRTICPSQFVFLDAGPGYTSYNWSNGATTRTLNTNVAGCYWVRVTDALLNVQSDTMHIYYLPPPVADFAFLGPTGNGSDQAVANNSLNASAYLWDFGDGSYAYQANPVHNFPANGSYTICLTAYNDCTSDMYCQTVNVTWKTGNVKKALPSQGGISLAPSVTDGPFVLNLGDQAAGVTKIEMVSTSGLTVQTINGPYISNQVNLNLENQPAGIYYVMVSYADNRISKAVIKM